MFAQRRSEINKATNLFKLQYDFASLAFGLCIDFRAPFSHLTNSFQLAAVTFPSDYRFSLSVDWKTQPIHNIGAIEWERKQFKGFTFDKKRSSVYIFLRFLSLHTIGYCVTR